jgi:hypothetical protein
VRRARYKVLNPLALFRVFKCPRGAARASTTRSSRAKEQSRRDFRPSCQA